jgi:hypothetical protein
MQQRILLLCCSFLLLLFNIVAIDAHASCSVTSTGSSVNIACYGGNTGSATVVPSGGATPYSYSWSPSGGTAATASGLTTGTYTVLVTDANSCTTTHSFTIGQPASALTLSPSAQTNVSCNGGSNGSATVSATGGTPSYSYSWSPSGGTGATASGLTAGVYTVLVTDANTCTSTRSFNVSQPSVLVVNTTATATSCAGNDGAASASVSGGTPSYSYSWSPSGGTTSTASSLASGTYTVVVTDGNTCTSAQTATILSSDNTQPTAVAKNITVYLNAAGNALITTAEVNDGSNDACGIASLSVSPNVFTCANVGANTVTLTATDVNGNSSTATSTVTILDTVAPVLVLRDIILPLDASGNVVPDFQQFDNGSNEACNITSVIITPSSFTCADLGSHSITITVEDASGNSASATANVTIVDTTAPTAIAQNITAYLDATGNVSINAAQINNNSSDACGIAQITVAPNAFSCNEIGANTVMLTLTDVNGNTSSATATVTVLDTISPVLILKDITVYLDGSGNVTILPEDVDNGSGDECGFATGVITPGSFTCANVGTNTVTVTVTDLGGNTASASAVVTVQDTVRPVAVAQSLSVQLDATGNASITAAQINNGSTDACGIASLTVSPNIFTCANAGLNTVTLTVTDVNGNIATDTATVTVVDTTAPVAIAKNITVQLGATGNVVITGAQVDNGSSDDCGSVTLSVSPAAFTCANVGANSVVLTATDIYGNSATAPAIVTVQDVTGPAVVTKNVTVQLNAIGAISVTAAQINDGSSDACGIASVMLNPATFTCANVGTNAVILTVTDVNGNSSTNTAVVTVEDITAPIAAAHNVTVQLNASGVASVTAAQVNNGSSDACGIGSLSVTPGSFTCANVGANTVTLTVTDVNGNSSTATATVTVSDTVKPVTSCRNISVQLDANGNASITAAEIDNGSTDACGIASISVAPNTFGCNDIGGNPVTLTVTDNNGNVSACSAIVTVNDTVKPVAICQNITVYLNAAGSVSITAAQIDNGSTDMCGVANIAVSPTTFDCSSTGPNTVNLAVTDSNGNVANCTAIVTVLDTVTPVVVCQNISVQLDASGTVSITPAQIDNGSTDACGIESLALSQSSFDCTNIGTSSVVLTVTDSSGNVSSCTATVTVSDTVKPVAICQNISVQLDVTGNVSITAAQVNNGSNDACGIATLAVSPNSFNCSNVGANTVTLTVTDNNGNQSTCTSVVNVESIFEAQLTTNDTTICKGDTTTLSVTGGVAFVWNTSATDDSINVSPLVTTGYGVTVTDANGCKDSLLLTIVVNQPDTLNLTQSICAGDTFVFYNNALTSTGIYTEVFSNQVGCDSIIILDFKVRLVTASVLTQTICAGDTFNFDGDAIVSPGTYVDTITNSVGCDSIITLNLTVLPVSYSTLAEGICFGRSYQFGSKSLTAAGVYSDTLVAANGCDSIVTLTLSIATQIITPVTDSICSGETYSFAGYQLYASGIYNDTLVAAGGCDSIVSLTLTVFPALQPTVVQTNSVLSTQTFSSYQWLLAGQPVSGQIAQSYTPAQNGSYAVLVTDVNGCSATSPAIIFTGVGIATMPGINFNVKLYPTPAANLVYLETDSKQVVTYEISDMQGKLVMQGAFKDKIAVDLTIVASGAYNVKFTTVDGMIIRRMIKE